MKCILIAVFLLLANSVHGRIMNLSGSRSYSLTYEQAKKRCADLGGSLALPSDLSIARQSGHTHCSCGWLADKTARFPTAISSPGCGGRPGVHTCGWRSTWNAFCYFGGSTGNCSRPLGMESGEIGDLQLTSSTTNHAFWNERWGADRARLNKQGIVNAWMPHHDGRNQYIETRHECLLYDLHPICINHPVAARDDNLYVSQKFMLNGFAVKF